MGFRNPLLSLDASQITGEIIGSQLAADAIDGKVITGATLRTAATGRRVLVYNETDGGIVELWAGGPAGETPSALYATNEGVTKSLIITSGSADGLPGSSQVLLKPGRIMASAQSVALGVTGITALLQANSDRIELNGPVFNAGVVHYEWTTSGVAVPSGTLTVAGDLTKDTSASVGSGPFIYAANTAVAGDPGIYALSSMVSLNAAATGRCFLELQVSGVTVARAQFSGEDVASVSIPAIRLDSSKGVRAWVYQSSGAARTLASRLRMTLLERL